LYIVSSRFEGGPQSIMECAVTKTPIISTDVGVASAKYLAPDSSIYSMDNFKEARQMTQIHHLKMFRQYITPTRFDQIQ
jgi:hypothetical protein